MADEFQLVAGHLALDFANTLDYRYDPDRLIDLLPSYERFLAFCRQSGIITAAQMRKLLGGLSEFDSRRVLKEVIELREALYSLILSTVRGRSPDEPDLRTLNGFLSEGRAVEEVSGINAGLSAAFATLQRDLMGPFDWSLIPQWF
jgi:predicted RNA-binding Zn ribbon-like protein